MAYDGSVLILVCGSFLLKVEFVCCKPSYLSGWPWLGGAVCTQHCSSAAELLLNQLEEGSVPPFWSHFQVVRLTREMTAGLKWPPIVWLTGKRTNQRSRTSVRANQIEWRGYKEQVVHTGQNFAVMIIIEISEDISPCLKEKGKTQEWGMGKWKQF